MGIRTSRPISVTTTGAAGSASGNADSEEIINGKILAIHLNFHASTPATADVTITNKNAPLKTLLVTTDTATDGWYYPRYIIHSEAGVALTGTAGGDRAMHGIDDYVNVALAQGDALTAAVVAYIVYEE
jgi:hypothetical protein